MGTDHYFSAEPDVPEVRRRVEATIWGRDYTFTTATGTFSTDALDHATALLFRTCEPPTSARRLCDLGCGWGPIAVALADQCPDARVDAIDVNTRALRLTRENAAAAGVGDRVRARTPDQVDDTARYDELWSNPPLRIGKDALHDLLRSWLPRLAPDGVARLVVGRNLGADSLQRWLIEQGWDARRTASAKGFRILSVGAPDPVG